ncbi:FAD-dependent oxidoreductase [Allonocardiopsis opalescens]|uniref:Thioredoxin reductase (NADPH) n=1 Tax=Allonocardiopsis opalescens TaxID=1144618 RepID=A0A2T0Q985_9ACTN|nr:FAD-dependent oxidoreductase [Allonocardiopsis opalescens]PRY00413.1 thioredoxin reductase (NADPH) [Allonocardiopsis opalescens]
MGTTDTAAAERAAKPVILTVDDDPGVSRAIARDLRRRYSDAYRILRAEAGPQALESLREIRLRGQEVALLLADQRMPLMNGTEFLEEAMDLYPHARRVLLTAYADTDAAIQAINVVDLDHYLLKPWDPPEEKLYPVVDAELDSWHRQERSWRDSVRVVGDRWSSRCYELRDFLARNHLSYEWHPAGEPSGRQLVKAAGADPAQLPLVVTPDGTALTDPTDQELAAAIGIATDPAAEFYDLAVIGGGPAGLGASVYGASEGLRTVLVERQATGGQAGQSSRIENYLGFPDGVSGGQLTERARRQAVRFGTEVLIARQVTRLEPRGSARVVHFADGGRISAHTVILATGVSYRRLGAAGLDEFVGRGVYYGAALTEAPACADQEIYVVGGANSAGQAAMHLSGFAKRVHLLVRGAGLQQSMSHYLIEQIAATPNIEVHPCTEVVGSSGDGHLERLVLRDRNGGGERTVSAAFLFVFIGAEPHTGWLDDVVERDDRGFILAGPDLLTDGRRPRGWTLGRDPYHLETNVPGVFVAGDARADSIKRVASAVGEGAMAVALVHRYLTA